MNHLVIPLDYRLIDDTVDARPGEYRFQHNSAAQQVSELQSADRKRGDHCVKKRVFERHLAFQQSKRTRRIDVFFLHLIQHAGTRKAGCVGGLTKPECERGQD